jgi:hypothetical protein
VARVADRLRDVIDEIVSWRHCGRGGRRVRGCAACKGAGRSSTRPMCAGGGMGGARLTGGAGPAVASAAYGRPGTDASSVLGRATCEGVPVGRW